MRGMYGAIRHVGKNSLEAVAARVNAGGFMDCIAARDVDERDRGTSQASVLVIVMTKSARNVAPFDVMKRSRCRT